MRDMCFPSGVQDGGKNPMETQCSTTVFCAVPLTYTRGSAAALSTPTFSNGQFLNISWDTLSVFLKIVSIFGVDDFP